MLYPGNEPLTQREVEVIELVADGLSNREIADSMVITEHTVKAHLKHIFTKLEAGKRTQAVARARELGFLRDSPAGMAQDDQPTHNLPRSLIPLIGRDHELSALTEYLADPNQRLITVHGPGGIGKTHLAVEAARQQISSFRDGVFLVSLEPLESSLFLLPAIAEAIRIQFSDQGKRKDQLLAYLSDKQMLLVMDGFEHLLNNTTLVGELLAASPELKIIVTSRERLNIHGEALYLLKGISYPDKHSDETDESDAVTLFRYCVERILPGFQPDATDLEHIVEICRGVEGLPLGVLLAASWVNAFSIEDILNEIQQQTHLLEIESLSTLFQYKSLNYVFQRSWELLAPSQQGVFMRMAVFRGSFTRDAAQRVAGATPGMLVALVNKAILEWNPQHRCYRIHQLLRQYGSRQLRAAGVEQETRQAHFDYFRDFVRSGRSEVAGNPAVRQAWDHAIADLRAALQWALDTEQTDAMIELCLAMEPYWMHHGYFQEYFAWVVQALDTIPEPLSRLHAQALRVAGENAWRLGKPAASRDYARKSIQIWYHLEDPDDNEHRSGNYSEAARNYEETLVIARETENKTFLAMGLHGLGLIAADQQNFDQALAYYQESLDYSRQMGKQRFVGVVLCNMGVIAMAQENYDEAGRLYSEALEIVQSANDLISVVINLANLGEVAYKQRDCSRARQLSLESLQLARKVGFKMAVAHQLEVIAQIENADGYPVIGARLYGAAEALREAIDFPVSPREMPAYTSAVDKIRASLTASDFEAAWAEGHAADLDTVLAELIAR